MKILVESRAFHPSVGGLETLTRQLADSWRQDGHEIHVVTVTPLEGDREIRELTVHRRPSPCAMARRVRWADVFVQSGISLRSLHWPLLLRTPLVVIHHDMLRPGRGPAVRARVKRWATHLGRNVVISRSVAKTVPAPTTRIPNTFRPIFDRLDADESGREGLLFVGRLVSEKGADVALEALGTLRERGLGLTLTICGDGPERPALKRRTRRMGLTDAVTFRGWVQSEVLAGLYRAAEVAVVPSRYEPFGIVALEALASRCPVVASDAGGLPEAVGPCGILVEPGDAETLARGIEEALRPERRAELIDAMSGHVERHRVERVAAEYVEVFEEVVHGGES